MLMLEKKGIFVTKEMNFTKVLFFVNEAVKK